MDELGHGAVVLHLLQTAVLLVHDLRHLSEVHVAARLHRGAHLLDLGVKEEDCVPIVVVDLAFLLVL